MKIGDRFRTVLFKDTYLLESLCNMKIYSCNFHLAIGKIYVICIDRLFILLSRPAVYPWHVWEVHWMLFQVWTVE